MSNRKGEGRWLITLEALAFSAYVARFAPYKGAIRSNTVVSSDVITQLLEHGVPLGRLRQSSANMSDDKRRPNQ
jgi:hypothetical protein